MQIEEKENRLECFSIQRSRISKTWQGQNAQHADLGWQTFTTCARRDDCAWILKSMSFRSISLLKGSKHTAHSVETSMAESSQTSHGLQCQQHDTCDSLKDVEVLS